MLSRRSGPSRAAATTSLLRRTWHRCVRAKDTTIACQRFQYCTASLAIVKPLAGIGRHLLCLRVPALGASDGRFQDHFVCLLRHSAYPVMNKKIANAGSSTRSRYPVAADNPTTPSKMTRTGVKQHTAATAVPRIPVHRSLSFISPTPNGGQSVCLAFGYVLTLLPPRATFVPVAATGSRANVSYRGGRKAKRRAH